MPILDERDFAHVGDKTARPRADDVTASAEFRKFYDTLPNVVTRGGACRSSARPTGSSSISSITR